MTHQKNGATGGTKLTVTSDQNVTKMIKIAKIPIILPLQNQPNVTVLVNRISNLGVPTLKKISSDLAG